MLKFFKNIFTGRRLIALNLSVGCAPSVPPRWTAAADGWRRSDTPEGMRVRFAMGSGSPKRSARGVAAEYGAMEAPRGAEADQLNLSDLQFHNRK
jgi:hypothetical protein